MKTTHANSNQNAGISRAIRQCELRSNGKAKPTSLGMMALCLAWASILYGQQESAGPPASANAEPVAVSSTVPRLINFSGTINPQITQISQSQTQTPGSSPAIGLTFSLYELQEGGTPLWSESQRVQPDEQGHYTVLLGSTQPEGLPLDLFTSDKAQWLGVQPQLPGAGEQPRVLLVGMPYALKAVDADTLGGLPASAFVQAGAPSQVPLGATTGTGSLTGADLSAQATGQQASTGGSGTADYLPLWTNSTTLGDSILFQTGGKVGLGTTTPASTLDVKGGADVRGTLQLPSTGAATASAGKNSQPLSLQASAFNSSTSTAVNQTFNLQAEPSGNDTSSPAGKLNLLFGTGTGTPAETGLSIASNGKIAFASGQTFPGTGTITGVTTASGSGLTGGGASGTLTLGLQKTCATNQVLQWNGSSWVCASPATGTITGVTTASGSGLTGGGTTGTLSIGLQKTCATNQVLQWNGSSWVCATAGTGTITGVTAGTDLTGGGTSGTVTLNLDTTKVPLLSGSNTFTVNQSFEGNGNTATIGDMGCGSGYVGLSLFFGLGASCTEYALLGDALGNLYVNRPGGGSIYFRENNGNELAIATGGAISATGNIAAASFTGDGSKLSNIGTLAGNQTFTGGNAFTGGVGFYQNTTFSGNGETAVIGDMGCGPNSVGISFNVVSCNTYALLDNNGSTILNRTPGQNMSFREGNGPDQMTIVAGGGVEVVGTPFLTFDVATLEVENFATSSGQSLFAAYAPNTDSSCWIDINANLGCTGSKSAVVPVDDGTRNVALYAVESPENWFEDYGGGTLVNGSATVTLDPVFAQTINTESGYRVFVTPNGDCHGLYVTSKTPTSFEVHELGSGQANIDFDYRIIAKRKGYENVRLADKTEMVKGMKEHAAQRATAAKKP